MSDTGGGHRASAEAIEAAFHELYADRVRVEIVDLWTEQAVYPWNQAVPLYQWMGKNPAVWKMGFEQFSGRVRRVFRSYVGTLRGPSCNSIHGKTHPRSGG